MREMRFRLTPSIEGVARYDHYDRRADTGYGVVELTLKTGVHSWSFATECTRVDQDLAEVWPWNAVTAEAIAVAGARAVMAIRDQYRSPKRRAA